MEQANTSFHHSFPDWIPIDTFQPEYRWQPHLSPAGNEILQLSFHNHGIFRRSVSVNKAFLHLFSDIFVLLFSTSPIPPFIPSRPLLPSAGTCKTLTNDN